MMQIKDIFLLKNNQQTKYTAVIDKSQTITRHYSYLINFIYET